MAIAWPMANPNPSPATRFKPGQVANPTGKTAEQAARDVITADLASRYRNMVLSRVMERVEAGEDPMAILSKDVRGVLEYSENRAHGTPKQAVELAGDPERPVAVSAVHYVVVDPQEK